MFNKVKRVEPLEDYKLLVYFEKEECKIYDVSQLFSKYEIFNDLKDGIFANVTVDSGGYGISWNDNIDLSCNELYYNGKETN